MCLSKIGRIAQSEWLKSPDIRPDMNLELGAFVVMPNHFHGIVIIGKNKYNRRDGDGGRGNDGGNIDMDTDTNTNTKTKIKNQFGPQRKNLASVIRGFKSSVTIQAHKINADFAWKSLYDDRIIRDNPSFDRIRSRYCKKKNLLF